MEYDDMKCRLFSDDIQLKRMAWSLRWW